VQDLENEKALHAATSRRLDACTDAMAALARWRELKDIATTSRHKSHVEAFENNESEIELQKIKLEQLKELNEIKKLLQATASAFNASAFNASAANRRPRSPLRGPGRLRRRHDLDTWIVPHFWGGI